MSTVLSDLVAKLKWLFPLVDGCHCGYMTKIEEKKSLQLTATKQCHSTLVKSFLHCQAPPPPVLSSSAHKKKNKFSNWLCSQSHCLWLWTWACNLSAHKRIKMKCRWSYEQLQPVAPVVEITYYSHAYSLIYPSVGLAYQGMDIVFRFTTEYSSLRDFRL
jgi:hypothetical protein